MHINIRRFLALAFVALFFILLPIILNYTRGYRFDSQKNEMVRTGGISIDSEPRNAQVYLNGRYEEPNLFEKMILPFKNVFGLRKMGGNTPAIFQNLVPDEYVIKITKDGYCPWQKTLNVYSEQVLFIEEVNLFLENPEIENLISENIDLFEISPNRDKIAYTSITDKNKLYIFDLSKKTAEKVYQSNLPITEISWAPNENFLEIETNEKIILNTQDKFSEVNLRLFKLEESTLNLNNFDLENIKWDIENQNKFYFQESNLIYVVDINSTTFEIYHQFAYQNQATVKDFLIKDNYLWIVQSGSDTAQVKKYTPEPEFKDAETSQTIAFIPSANDYAFKNFENNLITVKNSQTKNIFVIDSKRSEIEKAVVVKFFADDFIWNKNHDKIIFWSDYEIGLVNLDLDNEHSPSTQEILARYSEMISNVAWNKDQNYIIFSLEDELITLELDSRDTRNTCKLLDIDSVRNFTTDTENTVYLVGQIDSVPGIYEVGIQ